MSHEDLEQLALQSLTACRCLKGSHESRPVKRRREAQAAEVGRNERWVWLDL